MPHKVNYKKRKNRYYTNNQRVLPSDLFFKNQKMNQNQDENEKWYNTDEAANYLSISPNALRILVHRAKVKCFKLGSRLRFRKIDLNEVLQAMED
jgi:excisionase family DNA binding protein